MFEKDYKNGSEIFFNSQNKTIKSRKGHRVMMIS